MSSQSASSTVSATSPTPISSSSSSSLQKATKENIEEALHATSRLTEQYPLENSNWKINQTSRAFAQKGIDLPVETLKAAFDKSNKEKGEWFEELTKDLPGRQFFLTINGLKLMRARFSDLSPTTKKTMTLI